MRTSSRASSRKRSASQAARAPSPNGGAAMRAISSCQCANCGSCARNQLNADRTSGEADMRATSSWTEGLVSDTSGREPIGMGSFALSYNAQWTGRVAFAGSHHYGRDTRLGFGAASVLWPCGGHARQDFRVTKRVVGLLRLREHAIHDLVRHRNATPFQPVMDVGLAAHGADVDDLLQAEYVRRHARVHRIRQFDIV